MIGVQDQGHRAVVDGSDLHIRTELTVLRGITQFLTDGKELLIQPVAQLGVSRIGKAGTAALAAVAVEGKLADHQHLTAHIRQASVHFSVFILENPQTQSFFAKIPAFFFCILRADAQKNQKALPDLTDDFPIDLHRGRSYSC